MVGGACLPSSGAHGEKRRIPALGEQVRFVFIPTFLGIIAVVECACGAHHLLTDLSDL